MKTKRLNARAGDVCRYRLDPQTIFTMKNTVEDLEKTLCLSPSFCVLIRRAVRFYGEHVQELTGVRAFDEEKQALILASGRVNRSV